MLRTFARNWWLLLLRGAIAILFGILAIVWPAITLLTLVTFFGAYALVDGLFAIISGIASADERERWWAEVLEGIVSILAGVAALVWPGITALVLLYLIAAWALVTGILEIAAAIRLRHVITNEWAMILSGVLSIIFAALLILFPGAGALGMIWVIGAYAILFGILFILLAFRVRALR